MTDLLADIVTMHVVLLPLPLVLLQPLKLTKVEPGLGVTLSVTIVPGGYAFAHVEPQLIVPTSLVTVPWPTFRTVSVNEANVTVTVLAALIVTVQLLFVVVQPPVKPTRPKLVPGVAVSVTVEPAAKSATQTGPQLMASEPSTTVPVPVLDTVSLNRANVAVTVRAAFIVA